MQHNCASDAGTAELEGRPRVRLSTCRISVVERSGYSLLPNAKRSSAARLCGLPINAKLQIEGSAMTGALV